MVKKYFFYFINLLNNVNIYLQAGIIKAEEVAPFYFKDIIALFLGSLSFAYAIESVNLHRRIALLVLSRVGTSTKWYLFYITYLTIRFHICLIN
jgi:di/tricarboxylate transporter